MLARSYRCGDAKGLDEIFRGRGITSLLHDQIVVTGKLGAPTGVLVYRPGAFVHELECGVDAQRRMRAESLANYAIAQAWSAQHVLSSAIFLVRGSNLAMQRFVESFGAVRQTDPGDVLYLLNRQ